MGKRKHKYKDCHLKDKIRRLENRLRRYEYEDSSDEDYYRRSYSRSPQRYYSRSPSVHREYISDSDDDLPGRLRSVATPVPPRSPSVEEIKNDASAAPSADCATQQVPEQGPSANATTSNDTTPLPAEILEALGDPKGKDEVFGPKIPEELSKRWGRVLVDGLTKEQKQEIMEKTQIPENFRLVKAPLLNPEIAPILSETVKNRDKLLEKAQNHLGMGISGLTNLASAVIQGDLNKIEVLKQISEISQIFLDLHHENTKTRRKLIITSLDKKFTDIIKDAKRDSFLFGAELGEKIKASKTAERSGLHIKRTDGIASSSRKFPSQGNWKAPPRTQGQRAYRQGGQKNYRYSGPPSRRSAPTAQQRPGTTTKTSANTRKP
ncbi:hypothetical protein NE865_11995 [Phthorimaea operculella]|nr:hypothetical protein NE865_11995 [Phthorimaea operculella]